MTKWRRHSPANVLGETVIPSACGRFAIVSKRRSARWGYGRLEYYLIWQRVGGVQALECATLRGAKEAASDLAGTVPAEARLDLAGLGCGSFRDGRWIV